MAFAFSALREPGGQTFGKSFGSEAKTGLQLASSSREGVIEVGRVGEISHAELIEPIKGARFAFATNKNLNMEFLGVHGLRIAPLGRKAGLKPSSYKRRELG